MFICTATCYELKSVASLFTVTKRNCQKTYVHLSENTSGNISKYVLENKQPINIFQTYAIQGKRQNCNICYYSAKTEFMFSSKFFVKKLVARIRTGKCS